MAPYHVRMYERRLDSNTALCVTLSPQEDPAPQDPHKAVCYSAGRNLSIPQLPVCTHDLGSRSLSSVHNGVSLLIYPEIRRIRSSRNSGIDAALACAPLAAQSPLKHYRSVYCSAFSVIKRQVPLPMCIKRAKSTSEMIIPATTDQFQAQATNPPFFSHPSSAFHETVF